MNELMQKKVRDVYQAGSDALLAQEFEKAVTIFDEVGNHLDCYESLETIDSILKILSNRGLAQSKLRNDSAAIENFSNLLDRIDIYRYLTNGSSSTSVSNANSQDLRWSSLEVKTLMRRATSYENIEEFRKALTDLAHLQHNHADIFRQNPSLQAQWLRLGHRIEEDRLAAKEDGRPSWMAHAHQSLRLNLIRALPDQLRVGQPFTCRLVLGNELGLFDRSIFTHNGESEEISENDSHWGIVKFEVFTVEKQNMHLPTLRLLCRDHPSDFAPIGVDGKVKMHLMFESESLGWERPAVDLLLRFSAWHNIADSSNSTREMNILPVISIPVSLRFAVDSSDNQRSVDSVTTTPAMAHLKAEISKMQINCLRPIQIPKLQDVSEGNHAMAETFDEILCGESVGLLGIGGKIWDSTFVLIKYLHAHRLDFVTGHKLLELGAGTGITSLALSRLHPAKVLCTDLPDVAPLISVNLQLNALRSSSLSAILAEHYKVLPLTWGEALPPEAIDSEVIIASDVVYYPEGYEPLLQTLEQLLSSSMQATGKKCCILAHRHRHPEDHRFFSMLTSSAKLQSTEILWQQELAAIGTQISHANDNDSVSLKDVRLFHISSK